MAEKTGVVVIATHGGDNPEKASLPFVIANASMAMDEQAVVILQGPAVFLAKKGFAENIYTGGFDPLKKLMGTFMELGGRVLVCSPCIKERHIDQTELIEQAEVIAGGTVIDECVKANAVLSY